MFKTRTDIDLLGHLIVMALHQSHYDDEAGIKRRVIQSSSVNLAISTTTTVSPVATAPNPLRTCFSTSRAPHALPMDHHARLGESEAMKAPTA